MLNTLFNAVTITLFVFSMSGLVRLGWAFGDWALAGSKTYSLTCYNSAFEISYMSPPNAVIGSRPSQYGVWTLEDGAYVQNSGETCIVEKAQVEVQK